MSKLSKTQAHRKDRGAFAHFATTFQSQPFTYSASTLAILASIGLGGAGVWRMVAPGVGAGEAMAYIGAGVAFAAIAVSEMTAAVTLLHADRRDAQDADARKWVARGVFAVAILANMLAGHQGAGAISDALIGPQREPIEARLAAAHAAEAAADSAVAHFDAQTRDVLAAFDADLRGTREAAAMAVTARRVTLTEREAAAARRESLRSAECEAVDSCARGGVLARQTRAEAETAVAEAALANAPKPMSEAMRWALALMFELVKSVLIWVATPRASRPKAAKRQVATPPPPIQKDQTVAAKINTGGWEARRERYGPTGRKTRRLAGALVAAT